MRTTHLLVLGAGTATVLALVLVACSERRHDASPVALDVTGVPCDPASLPYGSTDPTAYCNQRSYCLDTGRGFDCSRVAPATLDMYRCEPSDQRCAPCYCLVDTECQYLADPTAISTCIDPGDCRHARRPPPDAGVADAPTLPDAGTGSCAGSCGGRAPTGCWCDPSCANTGDCCADYTRVCSPNPTPDAGPADAMPGDADAGPADAMPTDAPDTRPDAIVRDAPGEGGT